MKFRWIAALLFSIFGVAIADSSLSPKQECETLMNKVLPFAEHMLKREGEFFPYGGALKNTGDVAEIAGYDGREHPPSMDIIKLIKQGFVAGAESGEYRATALVYDVRVLVPSTGNKSNAIAVSLNHRGNYSVIVFFPYELKEGELKYGQVFAQQGESDIFKSH
ncbi:hypothetical protein H8K32_09610 [Undibacterium jejuense]|uniref:DUF4251 domain-containing protein n=1 Tax=Undibacterium jejuense TaxID=1344949 RepID=A0A923HH69_9BURK|nr:hypothetical protein [Undibacterium jejuense]MBC3862353.1 hypothetical protein [Undibacterium jejuense]